MCLNETWLKPDEHCVVEDTLRSCTYLKKLFIGLNVFYFTKLKKDRKTSARLILIPLLLHKYTTEYNKDITIAPLLGLYRWVTQMH